MENLTEGAELLAESGKTYLAVNSLGQANVWVAVEKDNPENIVVLKGPSSDDDASWTKFQHEMVMHEAYKGCHFIRRQVDRILPDKDASRPPMLALEMFQTTLWDARTKRPFTRGEVLVVTEAIIYGLYEIHTKGLVYADLKMQNVMLNGFDSERPSDGSKLVVKLGDLGIVMSPSYGTVQPLSYRAPEVYFKQQITQAADIWAFGLVFCHLMEARSRFGQTGLYDDLYDHKSVVSERERAIRYALSNDYDLRNVKYYNDIALPYKDPSHSTGAHWDELRRRGLTGLDVEFMQMVLKADPYERPTARAILNSVWFKRLAAVDTNGEGKDQHTMANAKPLPHTNVSPSSNEDTVKDRKDLETEVSANRPAYLGAKSSTGGTYLSYC